MAMSTQQFINTYNNQYVLWRECVALFFQYNKDVVSGEAYGAPGAYNLWTTTGGQAYIWDTYDRIPNTQHMVYGDVVIWSGSHGAYPNGGWGHVAIYVSDNGNGTGKFFTQNPNPAQVLSLSYNGIVGYLRPKKMSAPTPPKPANPASRVVGKSNVNQRAAANTTSEVVRNIAANTIEIFDGYVIGESVSGVNIWFKDKQGYAWAGGFVNQTTSGLTNLTPKPPAPAPAPAPVVPALKADQRTVGAQGANIRSEAKSDAKVVRVAQPGKVETFSGYVIGENISGQNIWFKGSDGYSWAAGYSVQNTSGLSDLTPKAPAPAPTPKPEPVPEPAPSPAKYSFTPDFDFVEYIPVAIENVSTASGSFPAKPDKVVIHQFGTLGVDTVGSTINTFTNPSSQVSAHFVVSGKRIIQMVSLKDRAYHAYTVGNDYVGIETDPAQDADTIASTKKLLSALKAKYGYKVQTILHRDVPMCSTNCGAAIDLKKYEIDVVVPPVVVPPVSTDRDVLLKFVTALVDGYLNKK